jgi:hypothetical protein
VYRSFDGFLDVVHVSLAERQNNKRLECRWDCVSISRRIGTHKFSGQLEDVRWMLRGNQLIAMARMISMALGQERQE